jgi:hypothetical protein
VGTPTNVKALEDHDEYLNEVPEEGRSNAPWPAIAVDMTVKNLLTTCQSPVDRVGRGYAYKASSFAKIESRE